MVQKYDNGQQLLYIDFSGYAIYNAVVKVYEPSTKLYKINFRVPGIEELFFTDVYEQSLATIEEIINEKNSVNNGLPSGFNKHSLPAYIFVAENKLHVGTVNFAGQWLDYNADDFVHDVTHWYYREGFNDAGTGNARFYNEGEKPDEPN